MAETYPAPRFGAPREPKSPGESGQPARVHVRLSPRPATSARSPSCCCARCCCSCRASSRFRRLTATRRALRRPPSRWSRAAIMSTSASRTTSATRSRSASIGCNRPRSRRHQRSSLPQAELRIWVYRLPSLIGAIGAVLMTYWAALGFVTRRAAVLAALLMCASVLLGVEARLAKTDAMLLFCVVAAMGAMARAYLSWQRAEDETHPPWSWPAIFWTALAVRHPDQGPADPDVRRPDHRRARDPGPRCLLAVEAAPALGPDVDAGAGAALVRRDLLARGRCLLRRFRRRRHAEQVGRPGIPWRAARTVSGAVLDHVLARRAARGDGGAGGLARAARARRAVPAGLAGPVLDRVRGGADQAAALRAAAVSGDRDPHRGRAGAARAVARPG